MFFAKEGRKIHARIHQILIFYFKYSVWKIEIEITDAETRFSRYSGNGDRYLVLVRPVLDSE